MRTYSYVYNNDKKYDDFSLTLEVKTSGSAVLVVKASGENIKYSDFNAGLDYFEYIIDQICVGKGKRKYMLKTNNNGVIVKINSSNKPGYKDFDSDEMSKDIALSLGGIV